VLLVQYMHADRPADPPYPSPSVCAECCGSTDISSPPIWPHHWRAYQLTLVTSARKDCVQGRSAEFPGTARWCSSVPTAVYISRRHAVPTKTSVFHLGRSVRSCCQTAYTVGRRAFFVAGARVWNDLPADVTSGHSLPTFRNRLKMHLFPLSYPGLVP